MVLTKNEKLSIYITDYLGLCKQKGMSKWTYSRYKGTLYRFQRFVLRKKIPWDGIFTVDTLTKFRNAYPAAGQAPIKRLIRLLEEKKLIKTLVDNCQTSLPKVYETYLVLQENLYRHEESIKTDRLTLRRLYAYLQTNNLQLSDLKINHIDDFLAKSCKGFTPKSRGNKEVCLRKFLQYLYKKSIIRRNLGELIVSRRFYITRSKPPKFLRQNEIKELFSRLKYTTPKELRLTAMIHLAYSLGLRPREISKIKLDDIHFEDKSIILNQRKNAKSLILPVPEETIKAIAAYIIGGRPKTKERVLFLNLFYDHKPIKASSLCSEITGFLKTINKNASAYWLRHTYAQNLIENGVSIFEIKEMLGQKYIQSTGHYITVHTKLMRRVILGEEA